MVITRKIEVFVAEDDKQLRKEFIGTIQQWRDAAVKVANMGMSHLFMLDNTTPYLSQENREMLEYIGVKGKKCTKRNVPYTVAANITDGKVPMVMLSALLSNAQKMYEDDRKKGMWNRSLRSYKSNIPMPFPAKNINIRLVECTSKKGAKYTGGFVTVGGIPFQMRFGRDKNGNRIIVERILNQEYKLCTCSLAIEKKFDKEKDKLVNKMFLYLCVDIPQKEVDVDPKKVLYAHLDVHIPIKCIVGVKPDKLTDEDRFFDIGDEEGYLHRRTQIQMGLRRLQKGLKYSKGGRGRMKKLQAIERYHEIEKNYIDSRLHEYSKKLVLMAVNHGCGTICLVNQKEKEEKAKKDNQKGEPFLLRNWSYFGLKDKIKYKAKMYGINFDTIGLEKDKEDENNIEDESNESN